MTGLVVFGTRPEAVKLAPVVEYLRGTPEIGPVEVVCTGQHAEIMIQTLDALDLEVDDNLNLMKRDQTPMQVVERIINRLTERYADGGPDWVLVQGDTATAFAGAQFGYLSGAEVCHLEAGLRTHDIHEPWPEEGFRQEIARLSGLHLAPYACARENLVREGVDPDRIHVVGNTGLDSQEAVLARVEADDGWLPGTEFALVTLHRRENLGPRLETTCRQILKLLAVEPDLQVLWPVHPNPKVRQTAFEYFGDKVDQVILCEPLDYPKFLQAQGAARLVISDSGGVQEEAASMGTRVAIVREKTERPDAVALGLTRIVGADAAQLLDVVREFFATPVDPEAVAAWRGMQGNGAAGAAVGAVLVERLAGRQRDARRA